MHPRKWNWSWLATTLALALVALAPTTALAGTITPSGGFLPGEAERSVDAEATTFEPGQSSSESNSRSSSDLGLFDRIVSAAAATDNTSAIANADQISEIGDFSIVGDGITDAFGSIELGCAFAEGSTAFNYSFGVDGDTLADVEFFALAFGDSADAMASVELRADGQTIFSASAMSSDGIERFEGPDITQIMLLAGVEYEIVALATVAGQLDNGADSFEADAEFQFALNIVPEPGTLALLGPGIVALGVRRRHARR